MQIKKQIATLGRPKVLSAQDETRDKGTRAVLVHEIDLPVRVKANDRQFWKVADGFFPGVERVADAIGDDEERQGTVLQSKQKFGPHHVRFFERQDDVEKDRLDVEAKFSEPRGVSVVVNAKGDVAVCFTVRARFEGADLLSLLGKVGADVFVTIDAAQVEADLFPNDDEIPESGEDTGLVASEGEWLREGLERLGVSIREFARESGVNARSLSAYMKGDRKLGDEKIAKIRASLKDLEAVREPPGEAAAVH